METLFAAADQQTKFNRRQLLTGEAFRPPEQGQPPDVAATFAFARGLQALYPTEEQWITPNNRVVRLYDSMIKSGFRTCPVQPLKDLLEKPLISDEPRSTVVDYLMYGLQAMSRFDRGQQIVWEEGNDGLRDYRILEQIARNELLGRRLSIPPPGTYPATDINVNVALPGVEPAAYGSYVKHLLDLIFDTTRFKMFGFKRVDIRPGTDDESLIGGYSMSRKDSDDQIAILFPGDFGVSPTYWLHDVGHHELIHQLANAFGDEAGSDDLTLSELLDFYNSYFGLVASNHPQVISRMQFVRNHRLYGDSDYSIATMARVFDTIHAKLASTSDQSASLDSILSMMATPASAADTTKAVARELDLEMVRKSTVVDQIMQIYGRDKDLLGMLNGELDQTLYQSYYYHHEVISFLATQVIQDSALQKEGGLHEDPLLLDFANKALALGRNNMTVDALNAGLYQQAQEVGLGDYYSKEWAWWPIIQALGKNIIYCWGPTLSFIGLGWIINRRMKNSVKQTKRF